jgi:hypothetical protein
MYHRLRTRHGLQACVRCLREEVAYFRRTWRLAFVVCCPIHQDQLIDDCPNCGAPLAFHRAETGQREVRVPTSMTICGICSFDLRDAAPRPERKAAIVELAARPTQQEHGLCDYLAVLHQFTYLLLSSKLQRRLYHHLSPCSPILASLPRTRVFIEDLRLAARREIVSLALGLMQDPDSIVAHMKARRIRYNFLLRDLEDAPAAYVQWVHALPHKRRGPPRNSPLT